MNSNLLVRKKNQQRKKEKIKNNNIVYCKSFLVFSGFLKSCNYF